MNNTTSKRKLASGILATLLVVTTLAPAPAGAQAESPGSDSPGFSVGTEQVDLGWGQTTRIEDGKLQLTMWEAIEIALARNYGLVVERYNLEESSYRLTENMGIYDLGLTTDLSGFEETSASASNLEGAAVQVQENVRLDLGLSQLTPTGGTAELAFNNSRFETNSQFASVNPSFRIDLDLTYRQPLLRDLGKLATERGLIVARNNFDVSKEMFEQQVVEVVRTVGLYYWTVIEAREQLGVADESLRLAQELHEQNKVKVDVGTMAPLELIQSEAGVATRRDLFIRAQIDVGNAEDDLREMLNLPQGDLWLTEIVPQTPPDITRIEIELPTAINTALASRPEVRSKKLQNKNLEVDVDYFKNQKRPRLDFSATYGHNGLGGDVSERDFFTGEILFEDTGDWGDAWKQVRDGEFDGWNYALNFIMPIQNRAGKARSTIAEVAMERGEAELAQLELQVSTEVRKAARTVTTAEALVDSTRVSRRLEEENLKAEQKRWENGMSTSFQVLQIQEDLAEARSNAVQAETGYRKALIEFYRSTGTLDDEVGVEIGGE